ncbi:transposable element Tcb1 transposase [Trichonephila clavipes]|nr:transposable element Tcb1 transposase [Trichonephila clavipes]
MVWGAIEYTSRSLLARIDGVLNNARYISGVVRPMALLFIRALRNPTLPQDNAQPHVESIIRTFLDTENFRLLNWPARSLNLLQIEYVWSMVAEQLTRHHTPVTTVDELLYLIEAAWTSLSLYLYMTSNLCLTQ